MKIHALQVTCDLFLKCRCVPDNGGLGDCPPRPQNYTEDFIETIRAQRERNPRTLSCNPYIEDDCDTVPPLDPAKEGSVCGLAFAKEDTGW